MTMDKIIVFRRFLIQNRKYDRKFNKQVLTKIFITFNESYHERKLSK